MHVETRGSRLWGLPDKSSAAGSAGLSQKFTAVYKQLKSTLSKTCSKQSRTTWIQKWHVEGRSGRDRQYRGTRWCYFCAKTNEFWSLLQTSFSWRSLRARRTLSVPLSCLFRWFRSSEWHQRMRRVSASSPAWIVLRWIKPSWAPPSRSTLEVERWSENVLTGKDHWCTL